MTLRNIYKKLNTDCGCNISNNRYLKKWAVQGVFMMNAVLTVREAASNSHKGKDWEQFTDKVISLLNDKEEPVVLFYG